MAVQEMRLRILLSCAEDRRDRWRDGAQRADDEVPAARGRGVLQSSWAAIGLPVASTSHGFDWRDGV